MIITGLPAATSHRRTTRPRSQTTTGSLHAAASSSISRRGQTPRPTTTPTSRSGATAPHFSTCSLLPTNRSVGGEMDRSLRDSLLHRLLSVLLSQTQTGATPPPIGVHGFTPWAYKYVAPDGPHQGVETEWETSQLASSYNAYFDADACCIANMANAAFFQHYPTRARYVQVGCGSVNGSARFALPISFHLRRRRRRRSSTSSTRDSSRRRDKSSATAFTTCTTWETSIALRGCTRRRAGKS